jgi:hypothetical protein
MVDKRILKVHNTDETERQMERVADIRPVSYAEIKETPSQRNSFVILHTLKHILHPKETSGCVRPEWVNKWPNFLIAT